MRTALFFFTFLFFYVHSQASPLADNDSDSNSSTLSTSSESSSALNSGNEPSRVITLYPAGAGVGRGDAETSSDSTEIDIGAPVTLSQSITRKFTMADFKDLGRDLQDPTTFETEGSMIYIRHRDGTIAKILKKDGDDPFSEAEVEEVKRKMGKTIGLYEDVEGSRDNWLRFWVYFYKGAATASGDLAVLGGLANTVIASLLKSNLFTDQATVSDSNASNATATTEVTAQSTAQNDLQTALLVTAVSSTALGAFNIFARRAAKRQEEQLRTFLARKGYKVLETEEEGKQDNDHAHHHHHHHSHSTA